jgi:hypothetical protein
VRAAIVLRGPWLMETITLSAGYSISLPGISVQCAVLRLLEAAEHHAPVRDLHGLFVVLEFHALEPGVAELVFARGGLFREREALHVARAVADDGARDIHGGVARADYRHPRPQMIDVGVFEVIYREMDVAEALAPDVQRMRAPHARADENGPVAVAKQVVDRERLAYFGIGPSLLCFSA